MTRGRIYLYLGTISVLLAVVMAWYGEAVVLQRGRASSAFNGNRAYDDVKTQVSFGPRVPGSVSHTRTVDWIYQQLDAAACQF